MVRCVSVIFSLLLSWGAYGPAAGGLTKITEEIIIVHPVEWLSSERSGISGVFLWNFQLGGRPCQCWGCAVDDAAAAAVAQAGSGCLVSLCFSKFARQVTSQPYRSLVASWCARRCSSCTWCPSAPVPPRAPTSSSATSWVNCARALLHPQPPCSALKIYFTPSEDKKMYFFLK